MSHTDEQLRTISSWLPGFRGLEEVEDQIADLWEQLKALRAKAKQTRESLRLDCPLELDELESRFWSKVRVIDDDDSCWEWKRSRGPLPDNYGKFRWINPVTRRKEVIAASSAALFLVNGAIPDHGCHVCDNPPCCRPKHLYDGTHADNMRDKRERDRGRTRQQSGETNTRAKLTDELVIQGRNLARQGLMLNEIHSQIKSPASPTVLRWAITGRTWKHLDSISPPVVKAQNGSALKGKKIAHKPPAGRKFTDDQIRAIRWARDKSNPSRDGVAVLAEQYGVTPGMVSGIGTRRLYAHVTDQEPDRG